jgi:hypothetical protein
MSTDNDRRCCGPCNFTSGYLAGVHGYLICQGCSAVRIIRPEPQPAPEPSEAPRAER